MTEINGTFKGLMNAQFRKEFGAKIKRGQRGSVAVDIFLQYRLELSDGQPH